MNAQPAPAQFRYRRGFRTRAVASKLFFAVS
jgi:hypothetical protein